MSDWTLNEEDFQTIIDFAKKNDLKKVGLQFPNELVDQSVRIAITLQDRCPETQFPILADSPFGGCCIDEVAGQHYCVDGLVHLGSSCLTQVSASVPVLFVFGRARLETSVLRSAVDKLMAEGPVILFFDFIFTAAVQEAFPERDSRLIITEADLGADANADVVRICGRLLPDIKGLERDHLAPFALLYVGARGLGLTSVLLAVPHCRSYHVLEPSGTLQELDRVRQLRRRFLLIDKAAGAMRIGLVVSARGDRTRYLPAVRGLESRLRAAGKRCYALHIGKMTPAKLQNFPHMDCFVMAGCRQNALFDILGQEDFNPLQPVLSPFEMDQALKPASERNWDGVIADLEQLSLEEDEESSRTVAVPANLIVAERPTNTVSQLPTRALEEGHSWFGLEPQIGATPVLPPSRGRSGIAISYEEEPK